MLRETIIHKSWHDQPYVMVDKTTINDSRLSFKALGLLVYLVSKPNAWRICLKHLASTHRDGIDAVRTAMEELLEYGYARRTLLRNDDGTLAGTQTIISEVPFPPEEDVVVDPDPGETDTGQSDDGSTDIGKSNASKDPGNQEKKKRKFPLRKGSPNSTDTVSQQATTPPEVVQVLTHLNAVSNHHFTNAGLIPARLHEGRSIEDCILVINWIHEERRKTAPDWVAEYLDPVTPFRPINFDRYLQKAKQWHSRGGEDAMTIMAREVARKFIADHNIKEKACV